MHKNNEIVHLELPTRADREEFRDEVALRAMEKILDSYDFKKISEITAKEIDIKFNIIAAFSYGLADAMLRVRNRKKEEASHV